MLHDTQAAPETRAIRDKHLGLAEGDHGTVGDAHHRAISKTGSGPAAQRLSTIEQRLRPDCGIGIGAAALIVVSRAKRSLSVSSLSNGATGRTDGGKATPSTRNRVRRTRFNRTADEFGQGRAENIRLSESLWFLRRWPCIFLSTGCDGTDERRQRARIDGLKNHVRIYQLRAGMPEPYYVDVRESTPELHAHIVAAFPTKAAALDFGFRLERSPTYASWICGPNDGRDAWRLVHDWNGIFNYLSKEATPQAAWDGARNRFRRIRVADRSGSVSGDRVRPSVALERKLVALERIEPRTRTYAARAPMLPPADLPDTKSLGFCEAIEPSAAAVSCRSISVPASPMPAVEQLAGKGRFLSGDNGETVRAVAEQLALPMVAPVIDLAAIAEAKRKDLGISQREVARMLGIKQPHYSNSIVRRHDSLKPWARNRLREFAADRLAA